MVRSLIALLLLLLLSGCVTTVNKVAPDLTLGKECQSILLMPMDIELSALTAGGVLEPNAEWTANAARHVERAIREKFADRNITLLDEQQAKRVTLSADEERLRTQLIQLNEVVGHSILIHQYFEPMNLPNKKGRFDWTLGKEARFLKDKFATDYALIVYVRDSYVTAGRVAVMVVAATLGVGMPGGVQVGFASLVDLRTGQVVWFNRLARETGDMRDEKSATESVSALLADFPG